MGSKAILFSGQGAQYVGMFADVFAAYPEARAVLERANAVLGRDIGAVILQGPEEALGLTENTQPAVLTCEAAALAVLTARGFAPAVCAGFSLGEWAALVCAGVLDFETALRLVEQRALLMQQAVPPGMGGMAVILGKSPDEVQALCARAGRVYPSNFNCPGQVSVAGDAAGVAALMAIAEAEGVAAKRLVISVPSHCELMQGAAEALAAAIEDTRFLDAHIPIVVNCTGECETRGDALKRKIIEQLTHPVLFQSSIETMLSMGVDTFVEAGPGKTLCGLVKKTAKAAGAQVDTLRTDSVAALGELFEANGL